MRRYVSIAMFGAAIVCIVAVSMSWISTAQFGVWGLGLLLVGLADRRLFATDSSITTR